MNMDSKKATPDALWESLGTLDEIEGVQVLTSLFDTYERQLRNNPEDETALHFFHVLNQAMVQAKGCNLNRR